MNPPHRTCNKCGWVHFPVTRKHAEEEVLKFNSWYDSQSVKVQESYGGKVAISAYDRCQLCSNSHTNFRESKLGDCPNGCTIGPIIYEEKEEDKKD